MLMVVVAQENAEVVLAAMRRHPLGTDAAIIGLVESTDKPRVYVKTVLGSRRILTMPTGEQLPRIC